LFLICVAVDDIRLPGPLGAKFIYIDLF